MRKADALATADRRSMSLGGSVSVVRINGTYRVLSGYHSNAEAIFRDGRLIYDRSETTRRRRRARDNPSKTTVTWLVLGGLGLAGIVGVYFLTRPAAAAAPPQLPPTPGPTPSPTPTPAPAGPQNYHFGTNNTGGNVTLHPGDSVSFTFPNDPNAASTAGSDWFYTVAPFLVFNGRTTQVSGTQLQETDTFTYGGGTPQTMQVAAQFLPANNPALPTSGPNPPLAAPQANASTFTFTINTASP
jgi:hypothetical protein